MKDDYLWDKSGEPDTEIEHLERVLGSLRSKRSSRDLMPALEKLPRTKPRLSPALMAIAAAIAFAVLALGAFAFIQRQSKHQDAGNALVMVNDGAAAPTSDNAPPANGTSEPKQQDNGQPAPVEVSITKPKRSVFASRRRSINRSNEALNNEREQAAGLLAKEQLIKALEITSSKLNFVQKKVKGDAKLGPSS
jgi:hypothetical protein